VKRCSYEGCNNQARKGGVCTTHGAKREVKQCSFEGCTNKVIKGGVCWRHGANGEVVSRMGQKGMYKLCQAK
jgi:hypothetical protein